MSSAPLSDINTQTPLSHPVNVNVIEAINLALDHAMSHDENVIILGEDVAKNGGVFRATVNLKDKFGCRRVMDTPLAENLIAGISVGMATQGLKPVAEIQFMGFIYSTLEQLISHAARMRNRTRGRLSCPLVIRVPFGGGIHAPELHSESTEALLAHIPGLRVVIPSSPARAYGLLLSAINNPDPVVFLEPKRIYRHQQYQIDANGEGLPLDRCFTLREGSNITLISWGASIVETLEAANQLSHHNIHAEVIDVATIKPIDMKTLIQSVKKTQRCMIIHEAARSFGCGAEIAAELNEHLFGQLLTPIKRLCGYDAIMPYMRNEHHYAISSQDIVNATIKLINHRGTSNKRS